MPILTVINFVLKYKKLIGYIIALLAILSLIGYVYYSIIDYGDRRYDEGYKDKETEYLKQEKEDLEKLYKDTVKNTKEDLDRILGRMKTNQRDIDAIREGIKNVKGQIEELDIPANCDTLAAPLGELWNMSAKTFSDNLQLQPVPKAASRTNGEVNK